MRLQNDRDDDEPTPIADAYGLTKLIHQREDIWNVYLIPNQVSSPEYAERYSIT